MALNSTLQWPAPRAGVVAERCKSASEDGVLEAGKWCCAARRISSGGSHRREVPIQMLLEAGGLTYELQGPAT